MSDWRTRKGANLEKPSFDDECRIPVSLDRGVSSCELVLNGLTQNISLGGVIHELPLLALCFRFTINETKSHNWDVWDEVSGIVGKN
ncbi:hypothetical protein [Cuspidothrix issatschenkoi]|uniref:Uncharacterized protein n=1 Tax=Cuspidothrix issatschenkoi CHARLIE-1 TaxID=2052836 RepID=A0A2S6CTL5_9CYAN|nr:hypothetical protein [Cuspidothrix issatschenkoi]PPJ63114.1 hypothetical protein CUN59_12080 [Cuspidothrix issatschenkoi CHARLIE-1]